MSAKVKKNLRKSGAQFRKKLRKLRLRQNNDFLIKKKRVHHRSEALYELQAALLSSVNQFSSSDSCHEKFL